jgi:hypothetical protein
MRKFGTCYMCCEEAPTREHVPPLCFFPEKKDIPDKDYRLNLITVPSCADHNLSESEDDFYAFFLVCNNFTCADIAHKHFSTKIIRALVYRPEIRSFFSRNSPAYINDRETMMYEINRPRFDRTMSKMARALYFHDTNKKWIRDIFVHTSHFFNTGSPDLEKSFKEYQKIDQLFNSFLDGQSVLGENPDIFQYQLKKLDESNGFLIRFLFYRGFEIFAYSGVLPFWYQ